MRFFTLFVLLFCFQPSLAFINIESLRQNVNQGFEGSSGLALGGASGNVDVFNLGVNTQNIYRDHHREYILMGQYNYGEAKNLKNNNKGNFHVRYAQGFATNLFWETFAQAEFNEFQSLSLRKLFGGGLRIRLHQSETSGVFLGMGSFYEDEKISDDADQANFRGNIYLSFRRLINDQFETVLVAYYQPSYKRVNDYRLQLTAGFESKISEMVQLVNSVSFSSDTRPPLGIQEEDFNYSVVVNFSY